MTASAFLGVAVLTEMMVTEPRNSFRGESFKKTKRHVDVHATVIVCATMYGAVYKWVYVLVLHVKNYLHVNLIRVLGRGCVITYLRSIGKTSKL